MTLEYARDGLVGLLVPQANTTVEAEMRVMLPRTVSWIAGRLTSDKPTIEARLRDYLVSYGSTLRQFANAPLTSAGFACTGASYLLGAEREDTLLAELESARRHPVHTAATAIRDALAALAATRVALVSPYDAGLTEACIAYWESRGFVVSRTVSVVQREAEFHPIYALESDAAANALAELEGVSADAVVLLGTGLPTLRPIRANPLLGDAPVLSSNLSLAWRLCCQTPDAASLAGWVGRSPAWSAALY